MRIDYLASSTLLSSIHVYYDSGVMAGFAAIA